MDVQQFLAEFGHIANAPGGIAKLRELIFSLASDGKLLLDCKPIETTNLDKVADFIMGQAPPGSECNTSGNGTIFVKTGEFGEHYPIVREWTTKPLKFAKQGDVLICVVGATVGKLNLAIDCAIGRSVAAVRPRKGVNTKYLYFMLMPFTLRLRSDSRGSAQGVIGKTELSAIKLRVPSSDEQARIVAKVDELMALCDKLETQQQYRRKLQNTLRQSTLQAVATASSPHELQTSWARLYNNFGRLFHAPEDILQLRDVAFDLALRGLFLPESSLNSQVEITVDNRPSLPSGWEWKDLAELSEYITSGSRGWKSYIANSGDAFIRSQDIRQDALIFDNPAYVLLPEKAEGKRTLVRPSDLLLTITGGNVGKCAVVPELSYKAYVSQHVALIRLREPNLAEFTHFWMINAYGGRGFLSRYIYGDKPGLNLTQVGSVPIPVPPIASLPKIISYLRTHRQMCDRLAEQLRMKNTLAANLALAAVSTFTGITTEPEEQPMKAHKPN
ncbi:MAG: restriction endonuclease subunit S [Methylococcales bacterium]|nr:restriction endonuclease subunit S [Methylococcales bacterium]